jgi:hypothetical protein
LRGPQSEWIQKKYKTLLLAVNFEISDQHWRTPETFLRIKALVFFGMMKPQSSPLPALE